MARTEGTSRAPSGDIVVLLSASPMQIIGNARSHIAIPTPQAE
jgi:hypothetical protein